MASELRPDYHLNQPVWILEQIPGFFHYFRDDFDRSSQVVVGFRHNGAGRWAIVPVEWITAREV